ncbi:hypothetical protein [Pseudomonas huanghezhanensis]|uniref:hypothetical protein n=1 Tax=Pseudomonas huanghezhanensis TaxID=3002903 RepID=UPI0038B616C3
MDNFLDLFADQVRLAPGAIAASDGFSSLSYQDLDEISDGFAPGQIILNVSLRDISPDIIWQAFNVFDDVEHCMKANTSPQLAEQKYGDRSFVHGTLATSGTIRA